MKRALLLRPYSKNPVVDKAAGQSVLCGRSRSPAAKPSVGAWMIISTFSGIIALDVSQKSRLLEGIPFYEG